MISSLFFRSNCLVNFLLNFDGAASGLFERGGLAEGRMFSRDPLICSPVYWLFLFIKASILFSTVSSGWLSTAITLSCGLPRSIIFLKLLFLSFYLCSDCWSVSLALSFLLTSNFFCFFLIFSWSTSCSSGLPWFHFWAFS